MYCDEKSFLNSFLSLVFEVKSQMKLIVFHLFFNIFIHIFYLKICYVFEMLCPFNDTQHRNGACLDHRFIG